jgi:hypothetical protein
MMACREDFACLPRACFASRGCARMQVRGLDGFTVPRADESGRAPPRASACLG